MSRGLFALLLMLASPWLAQAADGAVSPGWALLAGSYDDRRHGVEELATSGAPNVAAALQALMAGQMVADGNNHLYIQADDGSLIDAITRAPVAADSVDADALRTIEVNNPVRRAIAAALGSLRLLSPDKAVRRAAAEAVFRARDAAALPALDRAIAQEKDSSIKVILQQARAAAILAGNAPEADRLAAVATIAARGDIDARAILASLGDQPPTVAAAASTALTSLDRIAQLWSLLQSVYYGISLGSVLLLAAAGLAITFGVMGVINMAHGEMVMLGAYTTFVVQQLFRDHAPALFGLSLPLAVPLAFLVAGAVGIAIERGLIRFLYGRPLETLLATWGLSLILQQLVRSLFGPSNREVSTPDWMSGAFQLGGLTITWNRLVIILFAVVVVAALMAVLRFTALGLQMRAVTQNRRMAASMGIRTPWIDALTFGLGSGVAGIAGVALSQIDNVSPNLGQGYIIDSFMVVVFGGVGNLWGTVLGALTLGVVNKFLEPIAGAVLGKIAVLVLLILFIQRRPRGMFPLRGRAVES